MHNYVENSMYHKLLTSTSQIDFDADFLDVDPPVTNVDFKVVVFCKELKRQ